MLQSRVVDPRFPHVMRNERGLSVSGTRLTLYDIIESIKYGSSNKKIKELYPINDEELCDVYGYIEAHREEVEVEYAEIVRQAEEDFRLWQEQNKHLLIPPEEKTPPVGKEKLWAKLLDVRAKHRTHKQAEQAQ